MSPEILYSQEVTNTETAVQGIESCVIRPELIPDHVREDIGRVGLEAVIRFYQNPENERRYQEWLIGYRQELARKGGST